MGRLNLNTVHGGAGNTDDLEISGGFYRPALSSVTAAGTTTTDAYVISTAAYTSVGTCGSGAGVRFLSMGGGTHRMVNNSGANACKVYPPTGGTINGAAANLPYVVSVGQTLALMSAAKDTLFGGIYSQSGNTVAVGAL